jgi:lysophospholipase L1-like esterase
MTAPDVVRRRLALLGAAVLSVAGLVLGAALPANAATYSYVPLGDSYAAGTGAGSYLDLRCWNSRAGYPSLIDADAGVTLTARATCSGATTTDVINTQVKSVTAATTAVTLTIGGNDLGFSSVVSSCFIFVSASRCNTALTAAETKLANGTLSTAIASTLAAIKAKSPAARVVVTGYPLLVHNPAAGSSGARINADTVVLNDKLEAAVAAAVAGGQNVRYVDVEAAFAGHGVGSTAPWINGKSSLIGPYHPNSTGQKAYAAAVRIALA